MLQEKSSCFCDLCDASWCDWKRYDTNVKDDADLLFGVEDTKDLEGIISPNSQRSKYCYKRFVWSKAGPMGCGKRVVVPDCVKEGIRQLYPDLKGVYMGHENK
jgi:hypothetical protein